MYFPSKWTRREKRHCRSWSWLLLLWLGVPGLALAADPSDLVQRALTQYKEGAYHRSLELLGQARDVARDPKVLGTIHLYRGLNLATINQAPGAKEAFAAALRFNPRLKLSARWIKPSFVTMLEDMRRRIICELEVTTSAPGFIVMINGRERGQAPLKLQLPIGAYLVELHSPSTGQRIRREVVLTDIKVNRIRLSFASTQPAEEKNRLRPRRRLWTWVVAGSAALCAGAALGVKLAAMAEFDDLHNRYYDTETPDEERITNEALAEVKGSIRSKDTTSIILLSVAGALTLGAAALYFLEGRPPGAPRERAHVPGRRLVVAPWLNEASGLQVGARF